jgi:glucose/arabinose dehydrogenase
MPPRFCTLAKGPMLRTALGVTLVTAASLGAQSQQQPQPQRLSQTDSAAIFAAARAEVARLAKNPNSSDVMGSVFAKRDSAIARTPDEIQLRADTAWVTLWTREDREGRAGQTVPVGRREGQWVALRTGTSYFAQVRYEP